jgi:hypothetical protein
VAVVGVSGSRYVVLHHTGVPQPHFDFLVEMTAGAELLSWRAPRWPASTGDSFVRLPDHRNAYLEYEGPVSGQRGVVKRVAAGWCDARLADGLFEVTFQSGEELSLVKDSPDQWLCVVARGRSA